jgi:hypothetical protein
VEMSEDYIIKEGNDDDEEGEEEWNCGTMIRLSLFGVRFYV